jgi:hypothetical protein
MKKMFQQTFVNLFIIISLLFCFPSFAQTKAKFFANDTLEVVYFASNKKSETLKIQAKILDYTPSSSCGILYSSGTIKVELTTNYINGDSIIYIVVPCLNYDSTIISKYIEINILPLKKKDNRIIYPIINKFDSGGLPFYFIEMDQRKIFQNQLEK